MQDDTSECEESFQDSQKMYRTSRFDEKLKRSLGTETEKIEEKRLQTNEFVEDL